MCAELVDRDMYKTEITNQQIHVRATCLEIHGSSSVSLMFLCDSHRWSGPSLCGVLDLSEHESRVLCVSESSQSQVDHACRCGDVHGSIRFYFGCT